MTSTCRPRNKCVTGLVSSKKNPKLLLTFSMSKNKTLLVLIFFCRSEYECLIDNCLFAEYACNVVIKQRGLGKTTPSPTVHPVVPGPYRLVVMDSKLVFVRDSISKPILTIYVSFCIPTPSRFPHLRVTLSDSTSGSGAWSVE